MKDALQATNWLAEGARITYERMGGLMPLIYVGQKGGDGLVAIPTLSGAHTDLPDLPATELLGLLSRVHATELLGLLSRILVPLRDADFVGCCVEAWMKRLPDGASLDGYPRGSLQAAVEAGDVEVSTTLVTTVLDIGESRAHGQPWGYGLLQQPPEGEVLEWTRMGNGSSSENPELQMREQEGGLPEQLLSGALRSFPDDRPDATYSEWAEALRVSYRLALDIVAVSDLTGWPIGFDDE